MNGTMEEVMAMRHQMEELKRMNKSPIMRTSISDLCTSQYE
jgi:hypothetical protein